MKILMFGWEFPPHLSGGLGAACQGLTKHLSKLGVEITFVLPRSFDTRFASHMRVVEGQNVRIERGRLTGKKQIEILAVASELRPYQNQVDGSVRHRFLEGSEPAGDSLLDFGKEYAGDLFQDVKRYAEVGGVLSATERFDIIHAHDWMSFPAALEAQRQTGKPLILHVHSTEFDRSGEHPNEAIYQIERQSLHAADKVIAVSHRTEEILISRYQLSPDKIEVVHNAVEKDGGAIKKKTVKGLKDKFVLFLGRVTFQKGPEYFVEAARQVLKQMKHVRFVMAGAGDLLPKMIERIAELRLQDHFHFTGFLEGPETEEILDQADLFVMPSVSEPFGIAPMEAILHHVPVIISKQSGVGEVLPHAVKVDFWNVGELSAKIMELLKKPALAKKIVKETEKDLKSVDWDHSASEVLRIYKSFRRS